MRGFHYTFQKVLDLKTNTKKQSEWVLSQAIGHLQSEETRVASIQEERQQLADKLQNLCATCAPVKEIMALQEYIGYLDQELLNGFERVKRAEVQVQEKQAHLFECVSDEKLWLKAREKAQFAFQQEVLRAEQIEMDEMATVRYHMAAR